MILAVIIALLGFEEVVDDVFHDPAEGDLEAQRFDESIGQWARAMRSGWLTQVMTDLTALGSVSVVGTLFVLLISVLAIYRDFRGMIFLAIAGAGAGIWPWLLKKYYGRARPLEIDQLVRVSDLSFPSGHAFGAAAVYIALAYYAGRYARRWSQEVFFYCLGAVLILIVGASRIYLGVHFPTDVLGGLSAGAAWGFSASAVYEFLHPRRRDTAPTR